MNDLDPRLERALRPMVDDVAAATDLPAFSEVHGRAQRRQRRRRTQMAVASVAVAASLVVGVVGLDVLDTNDSSPQPAGPAGPTGSSSPAPTAVEPTRTDETDGTDGAEISGEAADLVAAPTSVAHSSRTTSAGDVATVWGDATGENWALAIRPVDGETTAVSLPAAAVPPLLVAHADGFLAFDPTTSTATAVDLEGSVTQPEPTGGNPSPKAGDVAFVAAPGADEESTVRLFSPARGEIAQFPPIDADTDADADAAVDAVTAAVVTGSGDVVASWTTFEDIEADQGAQAGVARWDGNQWESTVLDTSPVTGGGVQPTTTSGLLAAAGTWLVATTSYDREATSVSTMWTSPDDGATWTQQDLPATPAAFSAIAITPTGTLVIDDAETTNVIRIPAGGEPARSTDPALDTGPYHYLAESLWGAGDTIWGRDTDGTTLWSTDDATTWTPTPVAGR
ncbi:hypothetical protein [Nocardioides alkalitolerans]|uniref:hypothetical protein n=1 Tax=Nocardioides alkalitolerans TaxID=281714 RepID=UPI000413FFB0|nr:hypothetical protein [Nocardioides alkalitolerans]